MLIPILIFVLVGCMGLFAALRPEAYIQSFSAEYQRKALLGKTRAVSLTGWGMFGFCMAVALAMAFRSYLRVLAPVLSPLLFLTCTLAYFWWGLSLVRHPNRFLQRASEPIRRTPTAVVMGFGTLLLIGAFGFLYGLVMSIVSLAR